MEGEREVGCGEGRRMGWVRHGGNRWVCGRSMVMLVNG